MINTASDASLCGRRRREDLSHADNATPNRRGEMFLSNARP